MNETETERLLREAVNLLANAYEYIPEDTAASEIIRDWLDGYVGLALDRLLDQPGFHDPS